MALVLFAAPEGTNTLIRLDDPSLTTDEGVAMPAPTMTSADLSQGSAGGEGRMRRITQAVTAGADCTVEVCPVANGIAVTSQAEAFDVLSVDGAEQRIEHGVASMANRHAVCVTVTALDGPVALGACDVVIAGRRSTENA
jgi:hypothetical protein